MEDRVPLGYTDPASLLRSGSILYTWKILPIAKLRRCALLNNIMHVIENPGL